MNDMERMQNATRVIECLANGIHPITGEILKETIFDEPEVIRCLFYVKDVLQGKIKAPSKSQKDKFIISDNLRLQDFLQDEPICLSPFVGKIKDANNGVGPSASKIWELLIEKGYLYEGTNIEGKNTKLPTELGKQNGLSYVERHRTSGKDYFVVEYNRQGQELLIECIVELYSISMFT